MAARSSAPASSDGARSRAHVHVVRRHDARVPRRRRRRARRPAARLCGRHQPQLRALGCVRPPARRGVPRDRVGCARARPLREAARSRRVRQRRDAARRAGAARRARARALHRRRLLDGRGGHAAARDDGPSPHCDRAARCGREHGRQGGRDRAPHRDGRGFPRRRRRGAPRTGAGVPGDGRCDPGRPRGTRGPSRCPVARHRHRARSGQRPGDRDLRDRRRRGRVTRSACRCNSRTPRSSGCRATISLRTPVPSSTTRSSRSSQAGAPSRLLAPCARA